MEQVDFYTTIFPGLIPCFNCSALVPNGLVRRRMVQTALSRHPLHAFGLAHYTTVNLCGVCDQEIADEERAAGRDRSKVVGLIAGTFALAMTGMPIGFSVVLAGVLAWKEKIIVALVALVAVRQVVQVRELSSADYLTHFILLWVGVMAACIVGLQVAKRAWEKHSHLFLDWQRKMS